MVAGGAGWLTDAMLHLELVSKRYGLKQTEARGGTGEWGG